MTKFLIFGVPTKECEDGDPLPIVLARQVSYFGDIDEFSGFLQYLRDWKPENPWIRIFEAVAGGFSDEFPREPFSLWQRDGIDEDFRDLIGKMANFNPLKRITAREALEHKWFIDV